MFDGFSLLDPRDPHGTSDLYPGLNHVFGPAVYAFAGYPEDHECEFENGLAIYPNLNISELLEVIGFLEFLLYETGCIAPELESDHVRSSREVGGYVNLFHITFIVDEIRLHGDPPLTYVCLSGIVVDQERIIAAAILQQCEHAAKAIDNSDPKSLSFIWSIINELDLLWRRERSLLKVGEENPLQKLARKAANARHAENRETAKRIKTWYANNRHLFSSLAGR